jgi:ABC-type transport system substrate-binding protein
MRRNKFIFKCLLVGLSFALIIFAVSGCGEEKKEVAKVAAPEKKAEPEPAVDKGTLIFGRGGDSVGLDPAYETDGNSFMVCDNVFEALVFYADESTALEPGLAESWDITPDGKMYTFHLRKGVKFHDGTPFTGLGYSRPGAYPGILGFHGNG